MTNYPVTDPAEIAKLPDGIYQSVVGIAYWKQGERWFLNPNYAMDVGWQTITTTGGGIAARLVPEAQYELIRTQLEEHHASMKAQQANRRLRNELGEAMIAEENARCATRRAEAQLDRAVELLRSWRYHFDQCTFECGEPGRCPNCDTLNFLAEQPCPVKQRIDQDFAHALKETQQPCQRCGDDGWTTVIRCDMDGEYIGREQVPCPDCQGGAS